MKKSEYYLIGSIIALVIVIIVLAIDLHQANKNERYLNHQMEKGKL